MKKHSFLTTIMAVVVAISIAIGASTTQASAHTAQTQPNVSTASKSIEVSLASQTLTERENGRVVKTLHVSSGSGQRYCVNRRCAIAVTPRGSFRVCRKIAGAHISRLGKLLNPVYFDCNGGFAIHGSSSVPNHPASHGCVRITNAESRAFYYWADIGTPVSVY